jgi:hypothetical protein
MMGNSRPVRSPIVAVPDGLSPWKRVLSFTDDRALMGVFANGPVTKAVAWSLFGVISSANAWLVVQTFAA